MSAYDDFETPPFRPQLIRPWAITIGDERFTEDDFDEDDDG